MGRHVWDEARKQPAKQLSTIPLNIAKDPVALAQPRFSKHLFDSKQFFWLSFPPAFMIFLVVIFIGIGAGKLLGVQKNFTWIPQTCPKSFAFFMHQTFHEEVLWRPKKEIKTKKHLQLWKKVKFRHFHLKVSKYLCLNFQRFSTNQNF